jgi:hypothetical protein
MNLQEDALIVADIIKDAHERITNLELSHDFSMSKTRVLMSLQRHANELTTQGQAAYISDTKDFDFNAPISSILGKTPPKPLNILPSVPFYDPNIQELEPDVNKGTTTSPALSLKLNKTPSDVARDELKLTLDENIDSFPTRETDDILNSFSDIEIRGFAKRAGLPVTESTPKNASTVTFVNNIKENLKKIKILQEQGEKKII